MSNPYVNGHTSVLHAKERVNNRPCTQRKRKSTLSWNTPSCISTLAQQSGSTGLDQQGYRLLHTSSPYPRIDHSKKTQASSPHRTFVALHAWVAHGCQCSMSAACMHGSLTGVNAACRLLILSRCAERNHKSAKRTSHGAHLLHQPLVQLQQGSHRLLQGSKRK